MTYLPSLSNIDYTISMETRELTLSEKQFLRTFVRRNYTGQSPFANPEFTNIVVSSIYIEDDDHLVETRLVSGDKIVWRFRNWVVTAVWNKTSYECVVECESQLTDFENDLVFLKLISR